MEGTQGGVYKKTNLYFSGLHNSDYSHKNY